MDNGVPWSTYFGFICWGIWRLRNRCIFEENFVWPEDPVFFIMHSIRDFVQFRYKQHCILPKQVRLIAWSCPPHGFVKINIDGSAATNPGEIAMGGVCRDHTGSGCFGFTLHLGWGTILKAEIFAIYWAIYLAWERGYRKVVIESDSEVAVQKFHQPVAVRDPFYHVLVRSRRLLQQEWYCWVNHVYREANLCADFMANLALSGGRELSLYADPPMGIGRLLQDDLIGVARPRAVRV